MAACTGAACAPAAVCWLYALVTWVASPETSLAVFASEASIRIWTGELTPRARSRPKWGGMMSTARAALEASASSADLFTGQATTWKVIEARKASMKLLEAEEPSKSCTTIGRSLTVSERAALNSMSRTTGSTSASASVRQSRTIWVSSLRACATIRLMPAAPHSSMETLPCRRASRRWR